MTERATEMRLLKEEINFDALTGVDRQCWEILLSGFDADAKFVGIAAAMATAFFPEKAPLVAALMVQTSRGELRGSPLRKGKRPKPSRREPRDAIPFAVRKAIYERDGNACLDCGSSRHLRLDHIIPVSSGGDDSEGNLRTLCKRCNYAKGDKMPEVAA